MTEKKIVFSGIQPSGNLTIGNFLGAMKYFVGLQEDYECFFAVADMHAITVPKIPKDLRKQSLELIALYLATGIDPKKAQFLFNHTFISTQNSHGFYLAYLIWVSFLEWHSTKISFKKLGRKIIILLYLCILYLWQLIFFFIKQT